jgi:protein involved in temperature-dependent protein secretion
MTHVSAARIADSAITALISEQQARDAAQAARAQITAKPAYTPAPAGLMECYV